MLLAHQASRARRPILFFLAGAALLAGVAMELFR